MSLILIRPYYKHIVDGYDVIAESVTPVSEDRKPGKSGTPHE